MAASLHTRGHMGAAPPSFPSSGMVSQPSRYASGPSAPTYAGGSSAHHPPPPPHLRSSEPSSTEPLLENENIMNRTAHLNSSLYQICLSLKRRLAEVPGFKEHIAEMEEEEAEADDSTDPVTSMWNCLRRGYPLMTIYNACRPQVPLRIDPNVSEAKIGKAATFKFLQACLTELRFPASECFLITDLYGGDTTGFVKVTKVVHRVLDILGERGLLLHVEHSVDDEAPPKTYRQNIVREIVKSERDYVQHLENLQQFKNEVEEGGVISGNAVHDIFLNLNALLDFQRRFLIRIEQQNSLPESQQNWGQLFIQYKESFRVYEPFIANQPRSNKTVERDQDKLRAATVSNNLRGIVEMNVLNAFLLKPFQRLSKYPMLLEELRKRGGLDEERKADLEEGKQSAKLILNRANEAVDKEERLTAVQELSSRVEDWKGHKIDHFGELLLFGNFTVLKGEGPKEVEREVGVLLNSLSPTSYSLLRYAVRQQRTRLPQTPSRRGTPLVGTPTQRTPTRAAPGSGSEPPTPTRRSHEIFAGRMTALLHRKPKRQYPWRTMRRDPLSVFNGPFRGVEFFKPEFEHLRRNLTGQIANELRLKRPLAMQYKVYLFERILLCCKEINPNKPKNKMLGNSKTTKEGGKLRLQLKGRIFMQNVTDVVSVVKTDKTSYTIQIYWKGDPGVENFVIRFTNEEMMNKWREAVQSQKKILSDSARSSGQTGTSETEFTSMMNQDSLQNPYLKDDEGEEEENQPGTMVTGQSVFNMSRNASSTSLRSATAHGGSGMHSVERNIGRAPPPRFPYPDQITQTGAGPLTLDTSFPGEAAANSYFSPTAESPMSVRSSSQASMYPFPRQGTPISGWSNEDNKHRTAPVMGRAPSRDGSGPLNGFNMNGRTRPSLPVMAAPQHPQNSATMQSRLRSASTPDIHKSNASGQRRYAHGQGQGSNESIPVPPIPQHMAQQMRMPINRSQTSSPAGNALPVRSATQSPQMQRDTVQRHYQDENEENEMILRMRQQQQQQRADTKARVSSRNTYELAPLQHVQTPPMPIPTSPDSEPSYPTQLKVTIHFDPAPSHITIVVPIIIKHRSLVDRIDSKMSKISEASICRGTARLRYKDMDGDNVLVESDDDVQLAIEDWGTVHAAQLRAGIYPDFELQWIRVDR